MWKIEHQILNKKKQSSTKILKCEFYIKDADTKNIQKVKEYIKKWQEKNCKKQIKNMKKTGAKEILSYKPNRSK